MRIDHIALCVRDLEAMRDFYIKYFGAVAGELYHNPRTGLRTYFLTFDGETRVELMQKPDALPGGVRTARGLGAFELYSGQPRSRGRGHGALARGGMRRGERPARHRRRLLRKLRTRPGGQPRGIDGLNTRFFCVAVDRCARLPYNVKDARFAAPTKEDEEFFA